MTQQNLLAKNTNILRDIFIEKLAVNGSGGASAASTAFGADVRMIRLVAAAAVHIQFAAAPTAAATTQLLPALTPMDFRVTPGDKVAALADAAGATSLYISELDT